MARLKDIGEVKQIEIEGTWSVRPTLGNLDESRRIVTQYVCNDSALWFYHAEEKNPLSARTGANIWQMFSSANNRSTRGSQLMPSDLRKLQELLKSKSDKKHFVLYSASLRLLSGRMVLHIQGTEVDTQLEHNCVVVPKRSVRGWVVQELGFRFPRAWHRQIPLACNGNYSRLISSAWNAIEWNESMPPLCVPSKVPANATTQPLVPAAFASPMMSAAFAPL